MKELTVDLRDLTDVERGKLIAAGFTFSDAPNTPDYAASRFRISDERSGEFDALLDSFGEGRGVVTHIDGAAVHPDPEPPADDDKPAKSTRKKK